ncbi:glycosyltransferase family 4 protein [Tenacibaculum sp. C7A-26P2]|uniref:glycosyltransferase family 4 protein n=1 Tax=Tenacibaculum sp. C7A-26P2 TaxID=3447504 RepID=UPI003F87BF3C
MNTKKNILITIRQGKIGGGETHVLQIVENYDKNQFNLFVLSFTFGEMIDELKKINVDCYVIETLKPFDIRIWKKVKKLAKKLNIELIHAHGSRAMSNSFWASKALKIPIIYTVHGWSFHKTDKPWIYKIKSIIESFLTKQASLTICVSKSNQQEGEKNFQLENSVVIENGIDLNKFNPNKEYRNLKLSLQIDTTKSIVIYLSRLTKQKDPLTMIKSMQNIVEATNNIILIIVGDGEMRNTCEQFVKELNLTDFVIFLGFRHDIASLLNNSDIYCLPSLWEGLPIGLLEAMSMEKPCIATSVDGNKEVIIHNYNGILIEPKNHRQLSEQILNLHLNKNLRDKLAINAKNTIKTKYSIQKMIRKLNITYAKILYKVS